VRGALKPPLGRAAPLQAASRSTPCRAAGTPTEGDRTPSAPPPPSRRRSCAPTAARPSPRCPRLPVSAARLLSPRQGRSSGGASARPPRPRRVKCAALNAASSGSPRGRASGGHLGGEEVHLFFDRNLLHYVRGRSSAFEERLRVDLAGALSLPQVCVRFGALALAGASTRATLLVGTSAGDLPEGVSPADAATALVAAVADTNAPLHLSAIMRGVFAAVARPGPRGEVVGACLISDLTANVESAVDSTETVAQWIERIQQAKGHYS
jgi:hypothetical protein